MSGGRINLLNTVGRQTHGFIIIKALPQLQGVANKSFIVC